MGDLPQNDAASLSLEAALYDSKTGQFSKSTKPSEQSKDNKQAAGSQRPAQQRPQS